MMTDMASEGYSHDFESKNNEICLSFPPLLPSQKLLLSQLSVFIRKTILGRCLCAVDAVWVPWQPFALHQAFYVKSTHLEIFYMVLKMMGIFQ
jgi:hypothetical protein